MLEKIILINSANFSFLDVDLRKDIFVLGDNGSGKTTFIRAIHYLFSGDVRNLGIPSDKDGFKEYYFRYQNSYMIYVFEDFFIFLYKSGGEIVKLFSKQKFDLSKVLDDENKLYPIEDIRKYAKSSDLKVTVRGVSEYRDIVYGHNQKYLDFKFTSIKNSDIFIGLFNEIFNIDKSIIDSKSIKKAIQTTLDYEKKVIDFNYEDYLQNIYEFQSNYKFFKEFERQKDNIDGAYELQEHLLDLEHTLKDMKENIAYRVKEEKNILNSTNKEIEEIDNSIESKVDNRELKRRILKKYNSKAQMLLDTLRVEIKEINNLKEKFSQENVLSNQDKSDRYVEIKRKNDELSESFINLKKGFEDELGSIEKEIERLEYQRDTQLPREQNDKQNNQVEFLKNRLDSSVEKLELDFEFNSAKSDEDINNINKDMQSAENEVKTTKIKFSSLQDIHNQELRELNDKRKNDEEQKNQSIVSINAKIIKTNQDIEQLNYEIKIKNRDYEANKQSTNNNYLLENNRLEAELAKYKSMIISKENSFKEFLDQEVDGWEEELYPMMDVDLLDMSVQDLKPKLIDVSSMFCVELDKTKLKRILTKDEAQEKIQSLEVQIESLQKSYTESLKNLEDAFKEDVDSVKFKEELLVKEIASLELNIEGIKSEIADLEVKHQSAIAEKNTTFEKVVKQSSKDIETLYIEIEKNETKLRNIKDKIKKDRQNLSSNITNLRDQFKVDVSKSQDELKGWLSNEQETVNKLIKNKDEAKHLITKDERLKDLESELENIEVKLTDSLSAKNFLKEYENAKDIISSLNVKENELQTIEQKNEDFKLRLDKKIDNYEQEIKTAQVEKKELKQRVQKLQDGEEAFSEIKEEFEDISPQQSSEFLDDLVLKYSDSMRSYQNKKIDLKNRLDKLNKLKNNHHEIDIYFTFDEFDNNLFISQTLNIVTKLNEVVEFKNKKLEIIKNNSHKSFYNFINNLLPQKMSVFSDTEDEFISQVDRINENLSKIDFGVIRNIKIDTKVGDKKSIAKLLSELSDNVSVLSGLLSENSLFYDKQDVMSELDRLEEKFKKIKDELKGSAISLIDTIDLSLSFIENGQQKSQIAQIKNESSTGGSILLKMAIAISILKLFIVEDKTPFFLILDEVSRLHSNNQEKLRKFANEKGFGIIFVTPEPTYSKPESIKYYKFRKNVDDEFEVIELNV